MPGGHGAAVSRIEVKGVGVPGSRAQDGGVDRNVNNHVAVDEKTAAQEGVPARKHH